MRQRVRCLLPGMTLALLSTFGLAAQEDPFETLIGSPWEASGDGFHSTLSYSRGAKGLTVIARNELRGLDCELKGVYEGAYVLGGEPTASEFFLMGPVGEVHRGTATWEDGVLWHEASVVGGEIESYRSALTIAPTQLEFRADYGHSLSDDAILEKGPLSYKRRGDEASACEAGTPEPENTGPQAFIILLKLRWDLWARYEATGEWPNDAEASEALRGHVEYWGALRDAGRVVMTGGMGGDYWDNAALIVFEAPSLAEAEAVLAADPAVQALVFKAQVRPFTLHHPKLAGGGAEAEDGQAKKPEDQGIQPAQGPSIGGRLSAFEPFIGAWSPASGAFAEEPATAEFYGELYEWGPRGGLVRVYEFVHKTNRQRAVFEGIVYWHPINDRFEFAGYNAAQSFSFEGVYEATEQTLTRVMTVSYPEAFADTAYPEVTGRQRKYREVRTLTDPDTMELAIHMLVGGEWRPWPGADAQPFILRRTPITAPRL